MSDTLIRFAECRSCRREIALVKTAKTRSTMKCEIGIRPCVAGKMFVTRTGRVTTKGRGEGREVHYGRCRIALPAEHHEHHASREAARLHAESSTDNSEIHARRLTGGERNDGC